MKTPDTLFVLLKAKSENKHIPDGDLIWALRGYDKAIEKKQSVQLSKKARDKHDIAKIEKGVVKPKGLWLEHIIAVRLRVRKILDMFLWEGWRDIEEIKNFINKTFYAVYKLDSEKEEEYDAEQLIVEGFRANEKIKYFNEYTPKR